jgi:hypothetical protein
MYEHTLEYVLQPTESYFAWSMTLEQKEQLDYWIKEFVCHYCTLPFTDGTKSDLLSATYSIQEEDTYYIKRLNIKLFLKIKQDVSKVKEDIEKRLAILEQKYDNKYKFCTPDTEVLWNSPDILIFKDYN